MNISLKNRFFTTFALATLFFLGGTTAHAVTETTIGSQLAATIVPSNPGPEESATITLTSFATDLRNSTVTWRVNGATVKQGIGEIKHTFSVGKLGSRTSVVVTVSNSAGESTQKTLVFVPQDLSISWEAQTYTPPLYKGKALPAPGSLIRLIAVPEFKTEGGASIDPRTLTYRWLQNFEDIEGGVGRGVQTVIVKANTLGTTKVSLDVSSTDGTLRAIKSFEVATQNPEILFYKDRPLTGTDYSASITNSLSLTETETTLRAEPFHYSTPTNNILLSWYVNSKAAIADGTNPRVITLRKEKSTTGSAQLQASVSVPGFLFQEGRATLVAQFGN